MVSTIIQDDCPRCDGKLVIIPGGMRDKNNPFKYYEMVVCLNPDCDYKHAIYDEV